MHRIIFLRSLQVFSVFPHLILPLSVPALALWLGLLQDVLIPVSLGLLDSRFVQWVAKVYRCGSKKAPEGKLPHFSGGLDGKFRPFSSQPQSLEIHPMQTDRLLNPPRLFLNNTSSLETSTDHPITTTHKFPITNGSLYTSIDGRVPIMHNYRRPMTDRNNKIEIKRNQSFRCNNCNNNDFVRTYNLNLGQKFSQNYSTAFAQNPIKPYLRHVSLSQSSLQQIPLGTSAITSPSYSRLSKSFDSVTESKIRLHDESDEEYFDSVDRNYSSSSSCSITTEANCDFEFFKENVSSPPPPAPETPYRNFRITRSNSKRSLENLQAFIEETEGDSEPISHCALLRRSNSYISGISGRLTKENSRDEANFLDSPPLICHRNGRFRTGSVPDFKKIFVSEYI